MRGEERFVTDDATHGDDIDQSRRRRRRALSNETFSIVPPSLSLPNEYGMHDGEHEEWDAGCNTVAAIECPLSNLANNIFAGLKYG